MQSVRIVDGFICEETGQAIGILIIVAIICEFVKTMDADAAATTPLSAPAMPAAPAALHIKQYIIRNVLHIKHYEIWKKVGIIRIMLCFVSKSVHIA